MPSWLIIPLGKNESTYGHNYFQISFNTAYTECGLCIKEWVHRNQVKIKLYISIVSLSKVGTLLNGTRSA